MDKDAKRKEMKKEDEKKREQERDKKRQEILDKKELERAKQSSRHNDRRGGIF